MVNIPEKHQVMLTHIRDGLIISYGAAAAMEHQGHFIVVLVMVIVTEAVWAAMIGETSIPFIIQKPRLTILMVLGGC